MSNTEKSYRSEVDFLRDYNPGDFEKLSLTTDILIFSVSSDTQRNYRKLQKKHFSVLLVKRGTYPFKNKWCLPGGFVGIKENLEEAARRILLNETNIDNVYLEQLCTFGQVDRDPRMRIVSTSYMALVDQKKLKGNLSENAAWFDITITEKGSNMKVALKSDREKMEFVVEKKLKDESSSNYSYIVVENERLAFDHPLVISTGIDRLRNKIEYTDVVFNMMPEYFTLGELQLVYETILGERLLAPAFRRVIKDKVEKTDMIKKGGGHRPSVLYKYKSDH